VRGEKRKVKSITIIPRRISPTKKKKSKTKKTRDRKEIGYTNLKCRKGQNGGIRNNITYHLARSIAGSKVWEDGPGSGDEENILDGGLAPLSYCKRAMRILFANCQQGGEKKKHFLKPGTAWAAGRLQGPNKHGPKKKLLRKGQSAGRRGSKVEGEKEPGHNLF